MNQVENKPFAPCLTDDGKAVSILVERDDPESDLLFTNRSMKEYSKILINTLDFDKKNGFEIDWVIDNLHKEGYLGYKFRGWGMKDFVPVTRGNGTFGKFIEHVKYIFNENKKYEKKAVWKHDPDNYHMKKLWGHRIYHNLLNVCEAKIKPSRKEDVFSILKNKVLREVERQTRGKIGIFGETYNIGDKKEVRPCNNPLVLAGLCLIWPDEFFNIEDICSMREEELRNPKIMKRCRGKNCEYQLSKTIWKSKTIVDLMNPFEKDDGYPKGHYTNERGTICKSTCYCGKTRIEAWRTDSGAEIEESLNKVKSWEDVAESMLDDEEPWTMVSSTDDFMPNRNKEKEPIIDSKNKFNYEKYGMDENYRYDILSSLLISIFYGKRDYSVKKYITITNKKGNKEEKRNPDYGKILIKKELPLPETDIRLLANQILLKYKFFEKLEIEPSGKFKDSESTSRRNIRESIENYDFKNLVKGRVYTKESPEGTGMIDDNSYKILKSLEKHIHWGSKDRAAKHRLGRKITEIGQFLQWWDDLYPILQKLFSSKKEDEEPLRILKDGIRNVKGVNGD